MKVIHVSNGIKLIVAKGIKGDGVVWRGEWEADKVYDSIDAVSRGGSAWISKWNQNVGHDPLTDDGTWWDCMVRDSMAEAARDKAEQWANNPKNVPVEPGKYSAFHYKEKALAAQIRAEFAAANAELVALGGIPI